MIRIILASAAAVIAVGVSAPYMTQRDLTITPNRLPERECKTQDNIPKCRWLVYAEEGVFENRDDILFLKFNSADVTNRLKPNTTVCARVTGFRVGFMSWFPNIVSVKPGPC